MMTLSSFLEEVAYHGTSLTFTGEEIPTKTDPSQLSSFQKLRPHISLSLSGRAFFSITATALLSAAFFQSSQQQQQKKKDKKTPLSFSFYLSSQNHQIRFENPWILWTFRHKIPFPLQMKLTQFHLQNPKTKEDEDSSSKTSNGAAMRIIVPLQGVVQGRGGLVLGSVIPCALFYFLQLYLKRNRSPPPPPPPSPSPSPSSTHLSELTAIPRTLSRSHLSPRGSVGPANVSSRASSIAKSGDSPYYVGLKRYAADPYDASKNPNGVIQLGIAENRVDFVNF